MTSDQPFEVIDAAVHPLVRHADELREYMADPQRRWAFPGPERYYYPAPTGIPPYGEYREDARPKGGGLAGSDPEQMWTHLSELGVARAILLPLTRGLLGDIDRGSAICAATNDWLAETWLSKWNPDGRYLGSIRINPKDPDGSVREIERWGGNPQFVQIAVPLEAHMPYGNRSYAKIWECAERHGLPVAVHTDGGAGTEFYPTPTGYPIYHIEYQAMFPLNFVYHLSSLIAEGVFERQPGLKFVFADGGGDLAMTLHWRQDMDWPYLRPEIPWVKRRPTEYVRSNVRFCAAKLEGPTDMSLSDEWLSISEGGDLLMFASNYPHWSTLGADDVFPGASDEVRRRILGDNARVFYGLGPRVVTRGTV